MIDPLSALKELQRPSLLVSAARMGLANYKREKGLQKLLGSQQMPGRNQCILKLMDLEMEMESARKAKDPAYGPTRHVDVLTALMHEAQRPRSAVRTRQAKASATSDFLRAI